MTDVAKSPVQASEPEPLEPLEENDEVHEPNMYTLKRIPPEENGRICKETIHRRCILRDDLYDTPTLNDKMFLHYGGFTKIEGLECIPNISALWLECNMISKIENLSHLRNLKCLYLQNNFIEKIEGLEELTGLVSLDLSQNRITKIEGLSTLVNLEALMLQSNAITDITEIRHCKALRVLNLADNQITDVAMLAPSEMSIRVPRTRAQFLEVGASATQAAANANQAIEDYDEYPMTDFAFILSQLPELRCLYSQGNPVTSTQQYRRRMIATLPKLTFLDERSISPDERRAVTQGWLTDGVRGEQQVRKTTAMKKAERDARLVVSWQAFKEGNENIDPVTGASTESKALGIFDDASDSDESDGIETDGAAKTATSQASAEPLDPKLLAHLAAKSSGITLSDQVVESAITAGTTAGKARKHALASRDQPFVEYGVLDEVVITTANGSTTTAWTTPSSISTENRLESIRQKAAREWKELAENENKLRQAEKAARMAKDQQDEAELEHKLAERKHKGLQRAHTLGDEEEEEEEVKCHEQKQEDHGQVESGGSHTKSAEAETKVSREPYVDVAQASLEALRRDRELFESLDTQNNLEPATTEGKTLVPHVTQRVQTEHAPVYNLVNSASLPSIQLSDTTSERPAQLSVKMAMTLAAKKAHLDVLARRSLASVEAHDAKAEFHSDVEDDDICGRGALTHQDRFIRAREILDSTVSHRTSSTTEQSNYVDETIEWEKRWTPHIDAQLLELSRELECDFAAVSDALQVRMCSWARAGSYELDDLNQVPSAYTVDVVRQRYFELVAGLTGSQLIEARKRRQQAAESVLNSRTDEPTQKPRLSWAQARAAWRRSVLFSEGNTTSHANSGVSESDLNEID